MADGEAPSAIANPARVIASALAPASRAMPTTTAMGSTMVNRLTKDTRQEPTEKQACNINDVANQAEQIVRDWRYVLPRTAVFARMVYSFCARAEGDVFERITEQVSAEGRRRIDEVLTVPEDDPRSLLFRLKEYPPRGTPQTIKAYLECHHTAVRAAWNVTEIRGVSQDLITHLSDATRRYDAWYLKRLPEFKRYAMVTCFLAETRKTILDHLADMHDQHLTKQIGECRQAAEERQRKYWRLTREGQDLLVGSVEWMLEQARPKEVWEALLERTAAAELRRACVHYRESRRLEQSGYVASGDIQNRPLEPLS